MGRGGIAQVVPVTIGRDYGAKAEIVRGLLPTDNVILNPADSLVSAVPYAWVPAAMRDMVREPFRRSLSRARLNESKGY